MLSRRSYLVIRYTEIPFRIAFIILGLLISFPLSLIFRGIKQTREEFNIALLIILNSFKNTRKKFEAAYVEYVTLVSFRKALSDKTREEHIKELTMENKKKSNQ